MSYTLHRADALTVLKSLPDESVQAVITDPPYNSGGRTSADRTGRTARAKYVTSNSAHELANFPGENRDQRSYRSWLTELLTEAYRASTEHAVAMVFTDWRQEPTTSDALQMAGWTWSGTIPWIKPSSRPRKGGPKQDWRVLEPTQRLDTPRFGRTQRSALQARAEQLVGLTGGGTGLYDTALAAYRRAQRDYRKAYSNAVVLMTDGANDDPGSISLPDLIARLKAMQDPDRPVRIIAIGISDDADLGALDRIATATGGKAFLARDPADIATVFGRAVLSR